MLTMSVKLYTLFHLLVVHSFIGGELAQDVAADKDVEDDGDNEGDRHEGAGGQSAAPVHSDTNCPVFQFAKLI